MMNTAFFGKALVGAVLAAVCGAASAAANPVCLRTVGPVCRDPQAFHDGGIRFVKFLPGSFQRGPEGQAAWTLLGFEANANESSEPVRIFAAHAGPVVGEVQMLTMQNDICAKVAEAGIACARDYLAGKWYTYQLQGNARPFAAEFKTTETADLTAKGEFTTRRWACRAGEGAAATEVEVTCKGTYDTSLRQLYFLNDASIRFTGVTCAESQQRPATAASAALPVCDATGAFAAQQWQPFAQSVAKMKWANPTRLYLPERQVPLYFRGLDLN